MVRRWDPQSGGRRRALLRQILVPDRCKLQDLPGRLEQWEELVRRYSRSKSIGTTTEALNEDIKTAALEARVPSKLEQHPAMNRERLITFERVRSPSLHEARRSSHSGKITSNPMEVDSFGKGGKKSKTSKKGKGDSKNGKKGGQNQNQNPNPSKDVVCWNCCKKGHLSTQCWSNLKNQSGSGGIQNKRGKSKPKNGTGTGAGSLQPAPADSLDLASIETLVLITKIG